MASLTQLQRFTKEKKKHNFLAIHYRGMCKHEHRFMPTLNYSFVRNKHDGQAKKQILQRFPLHPIIMAEISKGEEKISIV